MKNPVKTNEIANILIVDDQPANLELLMAMFKEKGYKVRPALNGKIALQAAKSEQPDLILLDVSMPDMSGFDVCKELKKDKNLRDIPVIFISALSELSEKVEAFASGGVDYITKPFHLEEVYTRVSTHLKLRWLQREVEMYNKKLEKVVQEQVKEIHESQMATIFAIAKLAESRDDDTGRHLEKVQLICKEIALKLKENPYYAPVITRDYVQNVYHASPLHDIGKVAIPDNILLKPGKLTTDEFEIMKTHTSLGAKNLSEVSGQYPNNFFIKTGIDIAMYHHERWDGTGYPSCIAGNDIPLSARIMSVADVYEAVRSKRCYKPPFTHDDTCAIIEKGSGTQFDPGIVAAFRDIHKKIDNIYDTLTKV